MAKCPKCGYKLKIYDVSQFCPKCKTNLRFHNFEEEFDRSAKIAELNNAAFHVKMRHLKAAFVGSKLMIARLIVALLPAVMFLIPAGSFHFEAPYKSVDFPVSLMGVVNLFTGEDFGFFSGLKGSELVGGEFSGALNVFLASAVPVLFAVLVLFGSLLGFSSIKNMQKVICTFSALGFASAAAAQIIMYIQVGALKDTVILTGKAGFGLYAVMAAFAAVFAVNLVINKKGVPAVYDEGMVERARIYKEYKAGRVNIDELPQPVVETEETRRIEAEIRAEEEKMMKREAQSK